MKKNILLLTFTFLLSGNAMFSQNRMEQTNPTAINLKSVHFTDENNGWNVGNSGKTLHYNIPIVIPTITEPTTPTSIGAITISGTAGAGSTATLTQNDNALPPVAVTNGAWSISVTLTEGENTFTSTAASEFSESLTVTLDTTTPEAPIITSTQPSLTNDNPMTLSGTAEPGSTIKLTQNGAALSITSVAASDNGAWSIDVPLLEGKNTILVSASDGINVSDPSPEVVVTLFTLWKEQTSRISNNLYSVQFTDNDNGWAVGTNGKVINTSDGGTTWSEQTSNVNSTLQSIHFVNARNGWAVGNSGKIIHTDDGGGTWTESANLPIIRNWFDVHFTDNNNGWVVGVNGVIIHTSNGGDSWALQITPISTPLFSVHFIDNNNGWAVGLNGTIIHTADGGATWTPQTSPISNLLLSVHFTDDENGWAVGNRGTIIHTANGGVTWTSQASGVISPESSGAINSLHSVHFTDDENGWTVGFDGIIIHTTDGGATWTKQSSPAIGGLQSVHFVDADNGWAVGDEGKILHYNTAVRVPSITQPATPSATSTITILGTAEAGSIVTLTQNGSKLSSTAITNPDGDWSIADVTLSDNNDGVNTFTATASYDTKKSAPSSEVIVMLSTASNEDFETIGCTISPNPTHGIISITVDEKANYRLLNIRGQVLKKGFLDKGKREINISSLAKGIYLLNLKTDKGSFTKKVIKE